MTYVRTTATERKAAARKNANYVHVSVLVGTTRNAIGLIVPTRTPHGKGGTARRLTPKLRGRAARDTRV